MTTKELSEFFNVSVKTIQRKAEKLKIEMKKGQTKYWTKEEVSILSQSFKEDLDTSSVEVTKSVDLIRQILEPILKQQNDFNIKLLNEIKEIKNQPKQIELKQDYFSLLGYMKYKGIDEARFSEMIVYGKEASKISRELGLEIRKIPDERFGQVNSYHISVLVRLFEI
jgi:hypothetical protein